MLIRRKGDTVITYRLGLDQKSIFNRSRMFWIHLVALPPGWRLRLRYTGRFTSPSTQCTYGELRGLFHRDFHQDLVIFLLPDLSVPLLFLFYGGPFACKLDSSFRARTFRPTGTRVSSLRHTRGMTDLWQPSTPGCYICHFSIGRRPAMSRSKFETL